ncbi:hypothetical protein DDE18_15885 [Nocardioides gansuensis]|uniref:DUF3562 domain-containing protein n=1 Tax=Nocardioides gansuensis TaxID=2138300 RepID=A0A2T8F708_9ACTN|nr:hypothetical protein [Nocardioides gansuensis]PVG81496.1 hypothetical protein DDE18_15885 [Nocardioides gansuensis]
MHTADQVPVVPAQRPAERTVLHGETRALSHMIDRLSRRFPRHSRATVAEVVSQAHQRYDDSHLRDYVPVLVEREARLKLEHTTTQAAPTQEAPWGPPRAGVRVAGGPRA